MYIPKPYRMEDQDALVAFMRAHSFATLVSVVDGAPFATHLPLVVTTEDEGVTLTGHLARANPHWQAFGQGETLAIFAGPHAYVSPSLYEKRESVPTWNYVAVHAYGVPRVLDFDDQPAAVAAMLSDMIQTYESAYLAQWDDLSERFRTGMMQGIVGFTMRVTRLEGKAKLSQNRSLHDQAAVAQALAVSDDAAAAETGAMMQAQLTRGEKN